MQHKFYIYREKRGLGHPETAALVKKAAAAALRAEGRDPFKETRFAALRI